MLTDTVRHATDARRFVLRAVGASLGLFGLLRVPWIDAHLVLPFTQMQARLAAWLLGPATASVEATTACSGADALALCMAAVLAYPVAWRARLAGALGGAGIILGLNALRIGTLGRAAASPALFNTLHVYVWPALLTVAIAAYVLTWVRFADRRPVTPSDGALWQRFAVLTLGGLMLFAAAAPLYLDSPQILSVAALIARITAAILGAFGIAAQAAGNLLATARGNYIVTQECIVTPLVPVYVAAVCTYSRTWPRLGLGLVATVPLFATLGVCRLLLVALPSVAAASPLFLVHAFYQLLFAAVIVFIAARWRHGRAAVRHAGAGLLLGALIMFLFSQGAQRLGSPPFPDPQGAIGFLPSFQVGLYAALWVAAFAAVSWKRMLGGFGVLAVTQVAAFFVLRTLSAHVIWPDYAGGVPSIRAWAVAGPILIVGAVVASVRPRR